MQGNKFVFPVFVSLLLLLTFISITENEIAAGGEIERINGVSFVATPQALTEDPFEPVSAIGADWIAVMPYAFMYDNSTQIFYNNENQWWGEKSIGIAETVKFARNNQLKVLLKPHIWVKGSGWAGDFTLKSDSDRKAWEQSYSSYILHFAELADSLDMEAFCIGLELKHVVTERPEYWPKLIKKVRAVYKGKITYAANWDNYENITFWNDVDFIGINAYFPLSQEKTPVVNDLKSAWEKDKKSLFKLHKKYDKPIVFTEFGYRSTDGAAGNQWEFEQLGEPTASINFQAQEHAYQALFETFWDEPWFGGGFLWKWYSFGSLRSDPNNVDYTPQGKPVEKIILNWYGKSKFADQTN